MYWCLFVTGKYKCWSSIVTKTVKESKGVVVYVLQGQQRCCCLCVTGPVKVLLFMCYRDSKDVVMCYRDSKGVVVYVLQGQ